MAFENAIYAAYTDKVITPRVLREAMALVPEQEILTRAQAEHGLAATRGKKRRRQQEEEEDDEVQIVEPETEGEKVPALQDEPLAQELIPPEEEEGEKGEGEKEEEKEAAKAEEEQELEEISSEEGDEFGEAAATTASCYCGLPHTSDPFEAVEKFKLLCEEMDPFDTRGDYDEPRAFPKAPPKEGRSRIYKSFPKEVFYPQYEKEMKALEGEEKEEKEDDPEEGPAPKRPKE